MTEMANIVAKLAEKTDSKMAGKYGGVEHPPPPPFILGLAITLYMRIRPYEERQHRVVLFYIAEFLHWDMIASGA